MCLLVVGGSPTARIPVTNRIVLGFVDVNACGMSSSEPTT
jgi:hypothetical protein